MCSVCMNDSDSDMVCVLQENLKMNSADNVIEIKRGVFSVPAP